MLLHVMEVRTVLMMIFMAHDNDAGHDRESRQRGTTEVMVVLLVMMVISR